MDCNCRGSYLLQRVEGCGREIVICDSPVQTFEGQSFLKELRLKESAASLEDRIILTSVGIISDTFFGSKASRFGDCICNADRARIHWLDRTEVDAARANWLRKRVGVCWLRRIGNAIRRGRNLLRCWCLSRSASRSLSWYVFVRSW